MELTEKVILEKYGTLILNARVLFSLVLSFPFKNARILFGK